MNAIALKGIAMHANPKTDSAAFLLRAPLGLMILAHSLILKLTVFALPGTAQFKRLEGSAPKESLLMALSTRVEGDALFYVGGEH
jgi:hypothetical protein